MAPPAHARWKKGQSGNPGGRPKGESITAALRAALQREHNGRTIAELIAERLVREALSGKFPFAKEVLDRTDGKVAERHEISGRGGAPVELDLSLTDEQKVELALRYGCLDVLSPRLRELAERRQREEGGRQ